MEEEGIEVVTLSNLSIKEKFEENQETFEDNAKAKALYYYNLAKMPTLADDGGFEINYLNGQPGVKSRRWLGFEATDKQLIEHLNSIIKQIPEDKRTARFVSVCCLVKSPTEIYLAKNCIEGLLTNEYNDNYPEGFPYRAFFIEKTFNKYMMDLTEEEYRQIDHRGKNIEELIKHLV